MSGLRDLLQLPEVKRIAVSTQAEEFGRAFREGIGRVNQDLQVAAAQASRAQHEPLDAQRLRLIEAFQKASSQIDPSNPDKAVQAIDRVLGAVDVVATKASDLASGAQSGRDEWLQREPQFDDLLLQVAELEEADHPKAATLRKLAEAIRVRANNRGFQEAVAALDQLAPKLKQIYDRHQSELLREISELDVREIPEKVIDRVRDVAEAAGGVAGVVADEAKAAVARLIDLLKNKFDDLRKQQLCVVTVVNDTDDELKLGDWKFEKKRGGWEGDNYPPRTIGPRSFANFVATSPENVKVRGVEATVDWLADNATWHLEFSNPRLKTTAADASVDGENKEAYVAEKPRHGVGDVAHFEFVLGLVDDDSPDKPVVPPVDDDDDEDDEHDRPTGSDGYDAQASCLVTVTNNTQAVLTLIDQGHERGDFMTFPTSPLQPGASTSLVSVETPDSDEQGCQGFLLWEVGEPGQCTWRVAWDNPEQQKNTTTSELSGPQAKSYRELDQVGQGDENVPTAFTLSQSGTPSTPPPVTGGQVPVRVLDANSGEPIAQAQVEIGGATAATDNTGSASLGVPAGSQSYRASAEGYDGASGNVEVVEGDNPELVIELTACETHREGLTVLVKDAATGDPIESAEVSVGDQSDVTSGHGLATVELPVGAHDYDATAQGYESASGSVEVIEGDNPELVIEMTPAGTCDHATLAVVVVDDETSAPVADATVRVGEKTETTSRAGLVVLTLPPAVYDYQVSAADYPSPATGSVEVLEGDDNELTVRLARESRRTVVRLLVTDKEAGNPIEGAAVQLGPQSGSTDVAGVCELEVDAGSLPFAVRKESYQDATGTVEAAEGSETEQYVELEKEPEWCPPPEADQPTLRKGDESRDGWVEYLQKLLNHQFDSQVTQITGKFDAKTEKLVRNFQTREKLMVDGIVGNQTWAALREAEPRPPSTDGRQPHTFVEQGVEARWGTESDDFVLHNEPTDELWMLVVSVGDQPLQNVDAAIRITGANGVKKTLKQRVGPPHAEEPTGSGHLHLVKVPAFGATFGEGLHQVEAYLPGELGGDNWRGEVAVKAGGGGGGKGGGGGGKGGKGGPPPATGTATLEVHVTDAEGNPGPGVTVRISTGPTAVPDGTTDANGIVTFALLPGEYHVNAAFRNVVWQPAHVRPGALVPGQTYPVTMNKPILPEEQETGKVMGIVMDEATNAPVETATMSVGGQGPNSVGVGVFFFDQLPPGSQPFSVTAPGYTAQQGNVTVVAGEQVTQDVFLKPATTPTQGGTGTVVVKVKDTEGQPLHAAILRLIGNRTYQATGSPATIGGVDAGQYIYQVQAAGYLGMESQLEVKANTTLQFEATLQRS
jgi:uncharacterized membrane protein